MNSPRTILFSPGDSRRKIEKGLQSKADALLVDLEDAVAPSMKKQARAEIRPVLAERDTTAKVVVVRVNGWSTGLTAEDLDAVTGIGIHGVVLPKVEAAADIEQLRQALTQRGEGELAIYALIESARGLLQAAEIAAISGLRGLMFGGEDFLASIGGQGSIERHEILYARSALVTAARAYQLEAIDTIFTHLDDHDGLAREARLARSLGFSGKLCVHPDQIAPIQRAFQPTAEELAQARAIVAASEEHSQHGIGVFSFEGRMIDEAIVRQMRQLL